MNMGLTRLAMWGATALGCTLGLLAAAAEPETEPFPERPFNPGADERMGQAYLLITQASQAREGGDAARARETFEDALGLLESIETDYPGWYTQAVRHRILFCESEIALMQNGKTGLDDNATPARPATPEDALDFPLSAGAASASMRALKAGIEERDARVEELRAEIRDLKTKLRERAGKNDAEEAPVVYPAVLKEEARRLIEIGATSNAVALLRETLLLLPGDAAAAHLLSIAYCREGEYESAIRLAELLVKRKGKSSGPIWLTLGVAQLGLGNLGRARAAFEHALDRDPTLTDAHFNLAQLLVRLETPDGEGARRHYELAIQSGAARDAKLEMNIRQALLIDRVKLLK